MEEIKDSLNISLEIINTLLQNKEIKKSENVKLYQQYVGNDEIESLCDMIAEKMLEGKIEENDTINIVLKDDKFDVENETVHNAVEDGDKADTESKSNE